MNCSRMKPESHTCFIEKKSIEITQRKTGGESGKTRQGEPENGSKNLFKFLKKIPLRCFKVVEREIKA